MAKQSKANERLNPETHPDWYYDIPAMTILILGSFPPHEDKRDYDFFYPNRQNRFWKVLADIAQEPLIEFSGQPAVNERIALMEHLQAGVQNIGQAIGRKGKSAKDEDIVISDFQDILQIIKGHDSLNTILLPGFTGPSSTYHSFLRYLDVNGISTTAAMSPKVGDSFLVKITRPIRCIVANSTSRQARRVKYESLVEQFRTAILGSRKR